MLDWLCNKLRLLLELSYPWLDLWIFWRPLRLNWLVPLGLGLLWIHLELVEIILWNVLRILWFRHLNIIMNVHHNWVTLMIYYYEVAPYFITKFLLFRFHLELNSIVSSLERRVKWNSRFEYRTSFNVFDLL